MNWLYIGLIALIILIFLFVKFFIKRQYTQGSLIAALAHVPYYLVNCVAPIRGVADPEYVGYNFGLLHADPGFMVTIVAGSIVVGSAWSMVINLLNKQDGSLYVVVLTDLYLIAVFALPALYSLLFSDESAAINLGEYLRLSGLVVSLLYSFLFVIPIGFSFYRSVKLIVKRY